MNCQKEKCCVVRVAIPDADSSDRVSPQAPANDQATFYLAKTSHWWM